MKSPACRGWTLLETLAVLGLLAIALGLTGFGFRDWLPGWHLQAAAQDLVLDLQQTRWRALAQNQYYRLVFSPEQESYVLERESGNGGSRWPGLPEGPVREFSNPDSPHYHPGVDLAQVSRNPVFSPRGTAAGTTIILQSGVLRKIITVSSLGRVKVD
jgi:type II secretory pathway pseudopilin PulG